jgi:hypothetical protein
MRSRVLLAAAVLAAAAAFARPASAAAQRDSAAAPADAALRVVRLADGSVLYGRIVSDDGQSVVVQTEAGARVELQRAQIRSIERLRGTIRNGEVWPSDPNGTRLLFGPTARTLRQGEGHFADYELALPFVDYGVDDRFTVSGGTPIIPGAIGKAFYAELRGQIVSAPTLKISAGALAFATTESSEAAGVLYAVGTYGTDDASVTAAAGFPFVTGESIDQTPAIMLGGEYRVARRAKLLTENYFVPGESGAVLMGGVRFFGERLSADAGLGYVAGVGCDQECIFPVVNFVYSFGRR